MTTDLWMVVAAVCLQWVLILTHATPNILMKGPWWAIGNRHQEGRPMPAWHGRLDRANKNLLENLPLFIGLVLVAHVSGQADGWSALGAQVFVGARVVHFALYAAGVPVVRTVAWGVSVVGLGLIGYALVA